jgi:mono/diheme cytochrome c family protein
MLGPKRSGLAMNLKSHLTASVFAVSVAGFGLAGLASKVTAADASGELKPGQTVPSSNPVSGNPDAISAGKKVFVTWCAQCHGTDATGGKYGANLTIFPLGYKTFLATVRNGRVQKQMPPWKDVLDDDTINGVGAYLETLAQPGAYWR